jgi:uncharacterized protein
MSRIILPQPHHDGKLAVNLPDKNAYALLDSQADKTIRNFMRIYPRTSDIYERLISDPRMTAHWGMSNYLTVGRLNYNDHGPIHARVTGAYAMQLARYLIDDNRVRMDVIASGAGDEDDAMLVVLTAVMMHDIGNGLHRSGHEAMGVIMAQPILSEWLGDLYKDVEQRTLIQNFILSAIQCHDINPAPLYIESAIVAVADGCDMTKGRARMPFDLGKLDIHAVSALAIEDVRIEPARGDLPVEIEVMMSNSAGIFQVEETLVRKINATPLKPHVRVSICSVNPQDPYEKRIVTNAITENGRLKPI